MEENKNILNDVVIRFFKVMQGELLVRGIIFLILGLLMMFNPVGMLEILTRIVGIIIVIDGTAMFFAAISGEGKGRILAIIGAIAFLALGIIAILCPLMINAFCILMFGAWQAISGIQCIFFTKDVHGAALVSGILSLLTGIILLCAPFVGLIAIPWLIGLLILISGITSLVVGWKLRSALK